MASVLVDEVDAGNTRAQVLDSAIKVFSQSGFGGTRVREIADHAGVSHAMIKYYFGNKEQLWRAAVDYLFERQTAERSAEFSVTKNATPEEVARVVIEQTIRYCARHPAHARLVMQASMTPGPQLDWILAHLRKIHAEYYIEVVGYENLASLSMTTIASHYLMYGACHTVFTLEHEARGVYGVDVSSDEFIDAFVALATRVLVDPVSKTVGAGFGAKTEVSPRVSSTEIHTRNDGSLELRIVIPPSLLSSQKK